MSDGNAARSSGFSLSSIDPGKISAWLALAGTIAGGLAGFAADVGSVYSPFDTAAVFLVQGVAAAYFIGALGVVLGIIVALGAASLNPTMSESAMIFLFGVCIAVIGVLILPIMYDQAAESVQDDGEIRFIGGLEGIRIAAVLFIAGAMYLWYRFLGPGRQTEKP